MIQRIQTVWLMLATTCVFLTMHFATYVGNAAANTNVALLYLNGKFSPFFVLVTTAVGVATMITIFLFKNRSLQIKINGVALLLHFVLLGLYFVQITKYAGVGVFALVGCVLHLAVIVFLIMAIRAIYKDSKLVKDSDRLR